MTELDSSARIPGYYDSPFPGEDGGPRRQMIARGAALAIQPGEHIEVTSRPLMFASMIVLRDAGEVYVQGNSPPSSDTTSWVERVDPRSLKMLARSPELPGGPFWPGGILAHENGDLYVTYGRHCHRLDADCAPVASRRLPRDRPYNSLLALSDGNLVMKDFVRDGSAHSYFSVLEPERLEPVCAEVEIPEGSIARISKDIAPGGEYVYVIGDHTAFRYRYERGALARDESWQYRYRTRPDGEQSYGWDPVIVDGSAWFMDNGDNAFRGNFAGTGIASGPLHLVRVPLDDATRARSLTPFGLAHGTIVNPPLVDGSRKVAVAFDSGNSRVAGFRYGDEHSEPLWQHAMGASNHFLLFPESGEIVINDFVDGADHVAVLDIESGEVRARAAIGSPIQAVAFQSPGWSRDVYTCTFTTLARAAVVPER